MKTFVSEGAVHDFDLEGETLISDAALAASLPPQQNSEEAAASFFTSL